MRGFHIHHVFIISVNPHVVAHVPALISVFTISNDTCDEVSGPVAMSASHATVC